MWSKWIQLELIGYHISFLLTSHLFRLLFFLCNSFFKREQSQVYSMIACYRHAPGGGSSRWIARLDRFVSPSVDSEFSLILRILILRESTFDRTVLLVTMKVMVHKKWLFVCSNMPTRTKISPRFQTWPQKVPV